MRTALLKSVLLLAATCVGCTTSSSGSFILFPLPYKELAETKQLKSAHPNPIQWPRELAKNVTGPAVAEPGDLLSIAAVDPALRVPFVGEQPILLDGTIDLAKYGRVVVGYKTLSEVEAAVNAQLKAAGARELTVTVRFARAPESKRVYVLGDVVTPGSYPINGNETVLDAILLAGGLTRKADERNIILSRPTPVCDCRIVVPVCHEEIVQWGDTSTNYQLLPGDRIYVPTLSLWHRIFGRRNRDRCPPCGACPSACSLPEERCENGCGARPGLMTGPVEAVPAPAAVPNRSPATHGGPALNAPGAPAPMGMRLEERRLPPQSLRDAPRDASAMPLTRRMPAVQDLDPLPKPRSMRAMPESTVTSMDLPDAKTTPASTVETAKEPPSDWQSPWRPASQRTLP